MFSNEGERPFIDKWLSIKQQIEGAKHEFEDDGFQIFDLFGERVEDLREGAPDYPVCAYQYYNTYIGGDQNVYRCCVLAYNERGLLGSIEPFDKFWVKEETRTKLREFKANECERCQFNNKNRAMNYLLSVKPKHVEFP
jgi:MoaA/NifB/PqqE/SkfB family radical SAM enzyme